MKTSIFLSCVVALVLANGTLGRAGAAPRCYPNQRFTVSNGEVTDKLTHLVWQQQASATAMTWAAAKTFCPSGFRLPTVKELGSLVDLTVTSGATIDQTAFPGSPAEGFWTSTPYAASSGAWNVDFLTGHSYLNDVTSEFRVRCLR